MTIELSKVGILVGIVSLLGTGVAVAGKWFGLTSQVSAHGVSLEEMKAAYVEQDKAIDDQHIMLYGIRKDVDHIHDEIRAMRQDIRDSDAGRRLQPLTKED